MNRKGGEIIKIYKKYRAIKRYNVGKNHVNLDEIIKKVWYCEKRSQREQKGSRLGNKIGALWGKKLCSRKV